MFELKFHEDFYKDLKGLDKNLVKEVWQIIQKVKENPILAKRLGGSHNCFSIRIRNYRLVYCAEDKIYILILAPRKKVYEEYLKRLFKIKQEIG